MSPLWPLWCILFDVRKLFATPRFGLEMELPMLKLVVMSTLQIVMMVVAVLLLGGALAAKKMNKG